MHLPLDWPRINQFPEYFTVEKDKTYQIEAENTRVPEIIQGTELLKGYNLKVRKGECVKLIIKPAV
jgi:hypothetical protein